LREAHETSLVDKGDEDVACSLGDVEALVLVGQAARVEEGVALLVGEDCAVLAEEACAAALKVHANVVQRDVDADRGRVVVRPQERLAVWTVLDNKVQRLRPSIEYPGKAVSAECDKNEKKNQVSVLLSFYVPLLSPVALNRGFI
jgi:hypothetical protein